MQKLPPIEKVYEAWTAISDQRVRFTTDDEAEVKSSDGTRTYTIKYDANNDTYYSNDNASYWQGYPGYPVIACMMLRGRLPFDEQEAEQWKDVNWTSLNKAHKRDYAAAVNQIAQERGIDMTQAHQKAEEVMTKLTELPIKVKRLTRKQS